MNGPPLVDVQAVAKTYHRRGTAIAALRDVSFQVWAGELVVVAGPSGSGKTTLLNLVAALDWPDRGTITVAGTSLTRLSSAAAARYRNRQVGVIFQAYNLLPQLTALENVLLPMIPAGKPDAERAAELLQAVGLGDRLWHRPAELSGGEQQRVAIARALANDPPLVLADEPTGNLDDENARAVMGLLSQACRQRGAALILVTHDLNAVREADRVLALRGGSLSQASEEVRRETPGGRAHPCSHP
jgi:putative ABC transport system ATP-binding protein